MEDGALGDDGHGVALAVLGVLRRLGLALDLGPGIIFNSMLEHKQTSELLLCTGGFL